MNVGPDDEDSRQYTQDGINVAVLDPKNRRLLRAKPESRFPSGHFPQPAEPSILGRVIVIVVVIVLVALVALRHFG